jgi:hypothetical protein
VLEICLKEYFLKRKTLPTPLFRFFDLQKTIKEKKSQFNGDHDSVKSKDKDKERDKETLKRRKSKDSEKTKEEGKEMEIDRITNIEEEITTTTDVEKVGGKEEEKAEEKEGEHEVEVEEQTKGTEDVTEVKEVEQEIENKTGDIVLDGEVGGDRVREEGPGPVPSGPKTPSPIFLSDPAYALIDRDFCVRIFTWMLFCAVMVDFACLFVCLYKHDDVLNLFHLSLSLPSGISPHSCSAKDTHIRTPFRSTRQIRSRHR